MITNSRIILSVGLALSLFALHQPVSAHAGTIVSLVPTGDGLFSIHGVEVKGAASIDITMTYDPSLVANPQVVQGRLISGAMMRVNARDPGVVQIAVFREPPVNGTGAIVTLNFERKGELQGAITGLNARLTDSSGAPIPAQVQFLNASGDLASSGSPKSEPTSSASGSSAASDPVKPAVVPPGGAAVNAETGTTVRDEPLPVAVGPAPQRPAPIDARKAALARTAPDPAAREKKIVVAQKGVLEHFKDFKGARTPRALIGLFDQDPLFGCRQEPSPVLADGRTKATVTFLAPDDLRGTPDVAVINASLISIERDRDRTNTWIATVLPRAGAADSRMTLSLPDKTLIIPLTVAPKVALASDASGAVTEKDFEAYLQVGGGKGPPGRDLNGDGIVNYVDDFIFTANYLANRQRQDAIPPPGN